MIKTFILYFIVINFKYKCNSNLVNEVNLISTELANMSLREAREIFERDYLILQINRFGGNISKTASFVEMERSALHRKLKSLGISSGQKN